MEATGPEADPGPGRGIGDPSAPGGSKRASIAARVRDADIARVHPFVRATAEWSWRLIAILGALYLLNLVFMRFSSVLIPCLLALLGAAALAPFVDLLDRRYLPRSIAVLIAVLALLTAVAGILTFVVQQFIAGLPELTDKVSQTVRTTQDWLIEGPLRVDSGSVTHIGSQFTKTLRDNQDKVTSGALTTVATVSEIVTSIVLAMFLMIFFLYGGRQIWEFLTRAVPLPSRKTVRAAGVAGFGSLVSYVRATVAVAAVDAIGIGIGLWVLGVPLALPLSSLVFIGAFIPIVGALVTGALAVLVALITLGWVTALIVLGIVVAVMQIEGHVLQPVLMGRSVQLHPVAVVLAIASGSVLMGVVGALLSVPLVAFVNTAARSLIADAKKSGSPLLSSGRDPDESPAASGTEHHGLVANEPHWDRIDPDEAAAAAEK